jgi:hypothetical protein
MVLRIRTPLLAPTGTPPAPKVFVKNAGVWKQAVAIKVKDAGTWKDNISIKVKNAGTWRNV